MASVRSVQRQITSIIKLAQDIGWLKDMDEANKSILYRELRQLGMTGLYCLQRELEYRRPGKARQE